MRILLLVCNMVFSIAVYAQLDIKGIVRDSLGNKISRVTIKEKKNGVLTYSDNNGAFKISTKENEGVLIFKHIGYSNVEFHFNNLTNDLSVIMQSYNLEIDEIEVISTGYQNIPKDRFTGSFEHINNASINTRTGYDILEKIEGVVPGLQFDNRSGTPIINIRGISTLSTSMMEPLIILDNFPYQGDLSNINPNDIESVTVLKDAAATSIWGARAGNGVIVITSKKANTQNKLSYSNNFNFSNKPNLYYDQRINTNDFIDVELFLFNNNHYNSSFNGTRRKNNIFSPIVNMLYEHQNGQLSQQDLDASIKKFREINYLEELKDNFYQYPFTQQQHISLSSNSTKLSNRISLGYDNLKKASIGASGNRFTGKISTRLFLNKKIEVNFESTYSNKTDFNYSDLMSESYNPGGGKTAIYPYVRFKDKNGISLAIPRNYNFEYINSLSYDHLLDWKYFPIDDYNKSHAKSNTQHFQSLIGISLKPFEGFSFTTLYNIEKQLGSSVMVRGEESFYMRNLINRFTQVENSNIKHILPLGGSRNDRVKNLTSHNIRGQASYYKKWYSTHDISIIMGSELSHRESNDITFGVYGYDENRLTIQPIDYSRLYPIYDGLGSNSRIPNLESFSTMIQRYVSFYGNIGYLFRDRYGLSFSARKDASNIFGLKTNDKWNPLWSSGISWRITNENFMTNIPWVNDLNLRITYGHSGNSGGAANYLPTIRFLDPTSGSTTLLPRAAVARLSNPNLSWEDVATTNLGIDFSLLNHLIDGHIEVFNKQSKDLLSDDLIDITTGFSTIHRNVASISGHGGELRLSGNYKRGKFRGKTTLNFSISRSKVKDMYGALGLGKQYAENSGRLMRPILNKQLYPVFSYKFAGLNPENGNPQGILDGEVSEDYTRLINDSLQNLTYHGTALPPYYGSLIQSFDIGSFNISFLLSFKFGHYFQKSTIDYQSLFDSWIGHQDYESRWQTRGDERNTTVPSMIYPAISNRDGFYKFSDANILKGDVIRLQDINVSYNYSINIAGKKIKGNVFGKTNGGRPIWVNNVFNRDPDYFDRPPQRKYSLGLQLYF